MKIWDLFFLGHKNRQPFYEYNMDGQCTCDYTIENSAKKKARTLHESPKKICIRVWAKKYYIFIDFFSLLSNLRLSGHFSTL